LCRNTAHGINAAFIQQLVPAYPLSPPRVTMPVSCIDPRNCPIMTRGSWEFKY
jgi:hypothetical protein